MGLVSTEAATVYADGPSGFRTQPDKSAIRALFALIDSLIASSAAVGVAWKASVRVATTTNGTLASSFENGDTVDGVVLATGDRILLKDQSAGAANGIYVVQASGSPVRATDADIEAELIRAGVFVQAGAANGGKAWVCSNTAITVGTTSIVFVQIPGVSALTVLSTGITDSTAAGRGLLTAADAAAQLTLLGISTAGAAIDAVSAPVVALGQRMEWDRDSVVAASPAFYVPRSISASIGATSLNSSYGTASTQRPNHVSLPIGSSVQHVIYLDLADLTAPQKVAVYPTVPTKARPSEIIILAVIRSYRVVWSIEEVLETSDMQKDRVNLRYPLAVEKDKILVPTFYGLNRGEGTTVLYSPADGSRFWEFDRQTASSTEDRIVYDAVAAAAGGVPVRLLSGSAQPRIPTSNLVVEIASVMTREVHSKHAKVGYTQGGLVPNMFECGDAPDDAYLYSTDATTVVDTTSADLIALGLTRGVSGASSYYGGFLPEDTPLTGFVFARVYVQATADDVWGVPHLYIRGKGGVLSSVDMVMEKRISARAAIFQFFTQYSFTERPTHWFLGEFQSGTARVYTGGQIYIGSGERGWIARDDRPIRRRADVLYPSTHYSVTGRELPFFPASIVAERDDESGYPLTISRISGNTLPYIEEHTDAFKIDYTKASSAIKMTAGGRHKLSGMRYDRTVNIVRKTGPVTASPKILVIGDSITWRGLVPSVSAKLTDIGLIPSWLGTLKMLEEYPSTYSALFAEGRSGWAIGDFIYERTAQPAVEVGGETAYLARTSEGTYGTTRHQFNPFIRDTIGGDNAAYVRNGKIFDPRFYLNRFSGLTAGFNATDPDLVIIGLGTNDINEENAAIALARVQDGLKAMIAQTRTALPTAKIGIWLPAPPRSGISDAKWRNWYVPCVRAVLALVDTMADANVNIIAAWAHMTVQSGYAFGVAEAAGGQQSGWVSDDLHPAALNRQMIAEAIAQWIACVKAP